MDHCGPCIYFSYIRLMILRFLILIILLVSKFLIMLSIISFLFGQSHTIVSKPIAPTLIHDPVNRIIAISTLLLLGIYILYRVWRYFNES